MAHNFSMRARKVAWSFHDDKHVPEIRSIRRVGTDSTLNNDDGSNTTTSIRRVENSQDVSSFISALKKDGCVIVENFTNLHTLQKASQEVRPWLKARQQSDYSVPLIKQSPTVRNEFYANEKYQDLCEEFLTVETTRWKNDRLSTTMPQPILSSATTRNLQSPQTGSKLMRHDVALGSTHDHADKYQPGRDSMLGLIIPSTEKVKINAALGSHLYSDDDTESEGHVVEEELKMGEALIILGSLYYNITTQSDQEVKREMTLVHTLWSASGVFRPEESAGSKISSAELKTYPEIVQERLR